MDLPRLPVDSVNGLWERFSSVAWREQVQPLITSDLFALVYLPMELVKCQIYCINRTVHKLQWVSGSSKSINRAQDWGQSI